MDLVALIGGIAAGTVSIVGSITAYLLCSRWTKCCCCCDLWEFERDPPPPPQSDRLNAKLP
eukprot:5498496-Pleurochrysis_carterae.AAC.1